MLVCVHHKINWFVKKRRRKDFVIFLFKKIYDNWAIQKQSVCVTFLLLFLPPQNRTRWRSKNRREDSQCYIIFRQRTNELDLNFQRNWHSSVIMYDYYYPMQFMSWIYLEDMKEIQRIVLKKRNSCNIIRTIHSTVPIQNRPSLAKEIQYF